MRSMLRLVQGIALAAACFALFGGCANRPPPDQQTQIPMIVYGDHPPLLYQQTQIPMHRLWRGDRLQQQQVAYAELADSQKIPPDGTIELIRKKIDTSSEFCTSSGCRNTMGVVGYFAIPLIVLPVAIVALPFIAAYEILNAPNAKAATTTGEPKEEAPQTTAGESAQSAIDESVLRKEKERILSQESHARWLANVVMEGQWSSALDDAYISALNQALGWKAPPLKSLADQYRQLRLGSGISKIALLDSKTGERTLILCARSSVERVGVTFRYFETCQSGNIGVAMPHDSPASSEALRAVLVEQSRKLAALQARALTGQTEFVQVTW